MPRIAFNPYTSFYLEVKRTPKDAPIHEEWATPDPFIIQSTTGRSGVTRTRRLTLPAQDSTHDVGSNARAGSLPANSLNLRRTGSFSSDFSRMLEENPSDAPPSSYDLRSRPPPDVETASMFGYTDSVFAPSTMYAESVSHYDEQAELLSGATMARVNLDPLTSEQRGFDDDVDLMSLVVEKGTVFGVPLKDVVGKTGVSVGVQGDDITVPMIVDECAQFLLRNETNEAFTPTTPSRIALLQETFSNPSTSTTSTTTITTWPTLNPPLSAPDVGTLLATYLLALPGPLIPYPLYSPFRLFALNGTLIPGPAMIRHYQTLILQLPTAERGLILYLLDFFARLRLKQDIDAGDDGDRGSIEEAEKTQFHQRLTSTLATAIAREPPAGTRRSGGDAGQHLPSRATGAQAHTQTHNNSPTLAYLVKIRGYFVEAKLAVVAQERMRMSAGPPTPPYPPSSASSPSTRRYGGGGGGGGSNILDVLRGKRRPSASGVGAGVSVGRAFASSPLMGSDSVLPAGASR